MNDMSDRAYAMLIPLLAILVIGVFAGGLGIIFMLLYASPAKEWGVIVLGLALIIGVPIGAYMLQLRVEKNEAQLHNE